MSQAPAPLHGIRILDLSRLLPGPFCTLYLAQLGAEVIKIEEPQGGDYARTLSPQMFASINRRKSSACLDLRQTEDAQRFREMVREADCVLESFRPGVMDKLGCGYEALKAENSSLVYGALTGYGQDGPYKHWAGHDINYRAYAGELHQTGRVGGPPAPGNFQVADLAGGALTMALGLVAALLRAKTIGVGAFVDVAMLDGTFALQSITHASLAALGGDPQRGADMLSGGLPNYAVYECKDGKHFALGALEPKFWFKFCATVNRPDLAKMPLAAGEKGAALHQAMRELFLTRTRDEWASLLEPMDCCAAPVLSPQEALANAQLQARGMNQGGEQALPALPIKLRGEVAPDLAPAPALGEASKRLA